MASVDAHDHLIHPVNQEDPDMKDDIQTLKLLISILRPSVRLLSEWHIEDEELQERVKQLDELMVQPVFVVVQPLIDSNPTDVVQGNVQLVVSILGILRSLQDELYKIERLLPEGSSASIAGKNAEHLLSFIDCLLQNVKDVVICRANSIGLLKKVLEDAEVRLILLRNFLWPIPNRLTEQSTMSVVVTCAQKLAFTVSDLLYSVCLMNDEYHIHWPSYARDGFTILTESIHNVLMAVASSICEEYLESLAAVPDDTSIMDEQVLVFADYLIHKLRLLSDNEVPFAPNDLTDILIDELSFLRHNLMNLLLQNPIKEIKPLTISTQALIFETGLFIYMSLDAREDDPSPTATYCSFKLPDLLKAVDILKQEASDLFNKFFSESWQSNFPSTNVLEYVNLLISKLEELLHSKAAPLNALKHETEAVYEEIVSMRKLLRNIAELGNSWMESLLTRYKDAAYQTEYVVDSFVAGEGSIWCYKLGLFVVMKDVKILRKEVKSLMTTTMTCDNVIPSLSRGAPSLANNPPNINVTLCSKDEIKYRYELLSVLDLRTVVVGNAACTSDLVNIAKLVHLRYLAIRVNTDKIPSEIGNLQNLEIFILTAEAYEVMLPVAIWNLVSLRHIQIGKHFLSFQHCVQDFFQNFSQLDNLKSIFGLHVRHGDDVDNSSARDSVKQILAEQREMSNNQLNVTVVGKV
ncbi:hypothetical protein ACH5RR_034378 [Cinchona calisaya]|uniref:Disease resistance R13L4/SHOC-2-like LRR domain-containing protein n=1 Tax=Cinchona calisaya TaxID=153742 RepID=A0ABD2YAR0_9GENT